MRHGSKAATCASGIATTLFQKASNYFLFGIKLCHIFMPAVFLLFKYSFDCFGNDLDKVFTAKNSLFFIKRERKEDKK